MRRLLSGLASASLVFAVAACNRAVPPDNSESANSSGATAGGGAVSQSGEFAVGTPIRHRNLTIFPVLSKTPRMDDRFVTLDEGLKAGTVEVREKGGAVRPQLEGLTRGSTGEAAEVVEYDVSISGRGIEPTLFNADDEFGEQAEVNRVTIVNRSDKPLYLMPGEVIVGGLQDRTIAEEMIIPPTDEPVNVDVYCVEQGRWNPQPHAAVAMVIGGFIESEEAAEEADVKAGRGEFFAVPGLLGKTSRVAAQSQEGQSSVWNQVARANSESGVHSESSAYTANFFDERVAKGLQEYIDVLGSDVAGQERVVGVVVAINGQVESAEVFESTPLFLKLWPRLLRSVALDASHQADEDENGKTATSENAAAFLASILEENKPVTDGRQRGLIVSKRDTEARISFSAQDASLPAMGGSPVHAAGFSK